MEALTNYPTLLMVIGLALITLEFVVFGFGTLFLIFIALACFGTAALQYVNILPHSLLASFASVGVQSIAWAAILWKPLKAMQEKQQDINDQPNSLPDVVFTLSEPLAPGDHITHSYSGIEWKVFLAEGIEQTLEKGVEVEAVKTEVGKMFVQAVAP